MSDDQAHTPKTEQEWAEYYDNHRDDPGIWGKGVRSAPRKERTLSATVTVRFSPEEAELIRHLAKERESTYSDIVRAAVREYTQPRMSFQQGVVTSIFQPPVTSGVQPDVPFSPELHSTRGLATTTRAGWR